MFTCTDVPAQHLSRYGIRVNLRESERKRKPNEPAGDADESEEAPRPGPSVSTQAIDPELDEEVI
jgi:hypothetical protein